MQCQRHPQERISATGILLSHSFQKTILFLLVSWLSLASFSQPANNVSSKTLALFNAIRSGSSEQLQQQLANGASANDTLNSYSALMAATLNGSVDQMKILIDHGANVNYQSGDTTTALWLAVPDWDKTKLLLEHGADPNHTIRHYGVMVKLASIPGTINMFHLLIDHGADLKKMAPDNFLVYNAAASGDTAMLGFLLRSGLPVNDTIFNGDYPINAATEFNTFATVKMLIDHGANVNVAPVISYQLEPLKGFTPLMWAAWGHEKQSFLYLLDHGADPNAKSKTGTTALMLLVRGATDDPEMTKAILDHGARPLDKTPDGKDALYYAMQKGNDSPSVQILKSYSNK